MTEITRLRGTIQYAIEALQDGDTWLACDLLLDDGRPALEEAA